MTLDHFFFETSYSISNYVQICFVLYFFVKYVHPVIREEILSTAYRSLSKKPFSWTGLEVQNLTGHWKATRHFFRKSYRELISKCSPKGVLIGFFMFFFEGSEILFFPYEKTASPGPDVSVPSLGSTKTWQN